jgi:hypothetical protein
MKAGVGVNGFVWDFTILGADGKPIEREVTHNLIPVEGLAFLLKAPFGDMAPISNFYVGLFTENYVPSGSTKASDIPINMGEFTAYTQATRPQWVRTFSGADSYHNDGNKAEFTFQQNATILGAVLVSESTKGSGDGLVLSCVRFASPKIVEAGQTSQAAASLTYIPVS